jgi:hypothetical protein
MLQGVRVGHVALAGLLAVGEGRRGREEGEGES